MSDDYKAVVVRLPELIPLENCDNVAGAMFYGMQAIVSKDSVPGTLGIVFQAETQLSDVYLRMNNLYRHEDKNSDPTQKGYFEDNGRVRAVKFRGHRSDCFWMPASSLSYIPAKIDDPDNPLDLHEGFAFDELDGYKICEKYIPKGTKVARGIGSQQTKKVEKKFFPEHVDTSNFFRNIDKIPDNAHLVITQKLHGTSVRIGVPPVRRSLSWKERVARKLGVRVQEFEPQGVAGSRRVTKDPNKVTPQFYAVDIHSLAAQEILDLGVVPEGYVLYGEIIGWTPDGAAIQKGYTYQLPKGEHETYIYRVTFINPQGIQQDLSWAQVQEFCEKRGLKSVPEITQWWTGTADDHEMLKATIEDYLDERYCDLPFSGVVPLEPDNPCDEGVVLRVEGLEPKFYKAKSPLFLQHETKLLDKGEVDTETLEGVE